MILIFRWGYQPTYNWGGHPVYVYNIYLYIYIDLFIHLFFYSFIYLFIFVCLFMCTYMVVDQDSFIRERPFFANKKHRSRSFRELHAYLSRNQC